jgi:hypothetical protein
MTLRAIAATLLLCPLLVLTGGGCDARARDKQDMTRLMADRDICNENSRGTAVLDVYSEGTFKHYDELLKLGLNGAADKVRALGPTDKMEVLRMRLRATRKELARLTGRQYVEFATGHGWYVRGYKSETENGLRKFRFKADEATVDDGDATGVRVRFMNEDGRWKLDEPSQFVAGDRFIRRAAREEGATVDDYIIDELRVEVNKEIPASVWDPMPK